MCSEERALSTLRARKVSSPVCRAVRSEFTQRNSVFAGNGSSPSSLLNPFTYSRSCWVLGDIKSNGIFLKLGMTKIYFISLFACRFFQRISRNDKIFVTYHDKITVTSLCEPFIAVFRGDEDFELRWVAGALLAAYNGGGDPGEGEDGLLELGVVVLPAEGGVHAAELLGGKVLLDADGATVLALFADKRHCGGHNLWHQRMRLPLCRPRALQERPQAVPDHRVLRHCRNRNRQKPVQQPLALLHPLVRLLQQTPRELRRQRARLPHPPLQLHKVGVPALDVPRITVPREDFNSVHCEHLRIVFGKLFSRPIFFCENLMSKNRIQKFVFDKIVVQFPPGCHQLCNLHLNNHTYVCFVY